MLFGKLYSRHGEWTPMLRFVCLGTTIGTTVPVGYCLGVVNAPAEFIQVWCRDIFRQRFNTEISPVNIDLLWAVIVSLYLVGGIIGSLVSAWYSDLFGRKGSLIISAILLIVAGLLLQFSRDFYLMEMMLIGRLVGGIAAALIFTAQPMYLIEIAPVSLKSIVGGFTSIGVTTGALIAQIISLPDIFGTEHYWQYALSFYVIFVVIGFLPVYWYPESPVWLYVTKQRKVHARIALERLRSSDAAIDEELKIMEDISNRHTNKETWRSIFKKSELLLPFVMICSLHACQQLTGINASRHGEWTPMLRFVCLGTTIGTTVPVGYCLGVVNAPAEFIQVWCRDIFRQRFNTEISPVNIDLLWAVIVSLYLVGGIIGSLVSAWYSDLFGRKGSLIISAILLIVAGLLLQFSRDFYLMEMMLIGRLVGGIAAALIFTAQPMYLIEIAPVSLKSIVGGFTSIGVTTGALIAQIISLPDIFGTEHYWQYALSFYVIFVVIGFLPVYWYPESPVWLYVTKQRKVHARIALERLRSSDAAIDEELKIMEDISNRHTNKETWRSIFKKSELLLPFVMICSLHACQQLTGINAIFFYSISTFMKAGFTLRNAAYMNLGLGIFNVFGALIGSFFVRLFNRRLMLLISYGGIGVSIIGISFSLYCIDSYFWMPVVPIIFMASFIFFFQIGAGPIAFFIGAELLDVMPRPFGMSFGSFSNWLGNFLIGLCFPLLQAIAGPFAFLPWASFSIYAICLVYFYLPETRKKSVIEISSQMKDGFKSKIIKKR